MDKDEVVGRAITRIADGHLMFHNADKNCLGLLREIEKHLALCENEDSAFAYTLSWQIDFGRKFGC